MEKKVIYFENGKIHINEDKVKQGLKYGAACAVGIAGGAAVTAIAIKRKETKSLMKIFTNTFIICRDTVKAAYGDNASKFDDVAERGVLGMGIDIRKLQDIEDGLFTVKD